VINPVLSPHHILLSPHHICFITWSHLFYRPSTFHYHLIKHVLSPDHICFITQAPSIISWSNMFYHLIKCDQVIKQVWSRGNGRCSGDKTNVIRWSNKFDEVAMKGSQLIKQMGFITWSNLFYYLITYVLSPEHLPLPLDQTCCITWSHLFYYPSTFHITSSSNWFGARVITQMWSGDKTNVIRW
jgi:hypothetical protein